MTPFVWDRSLDDPSKIVGMEAFANQVALTLKGQTNVVLFGPRDTGKTTFTNQLSLELAKDMARTRLERLQRRGLVDHRDGVWYVVDPLFAEWLRRASPLAAGDTPA